MSVLSRDYEAKTAVATANCGAPELTVCRTIHLLFARPGRQKVYSRRGAQGCVGGWRVQTLRSRWTKDRYSGMPVRVCMWVVLLTVLRWTRTDRRG